MKTTLRCLILITTFGLLFLGCKKSEKNSETNLEENLLKSPKKYESLISKRSDGTGTFSITDIKRNGNILTVSVTGGCKPENFKFVWNGLILLSYPAQIHLVLHNDNPESCGTENQFNLTVDVSKIVSNNDSDKYIFHVANGSVKRDTSLNPDGSVSSK